MNIYLKTYSYVCFHSYLIIDYTHNVKVTMQYIKIIIPNVLVYISVNVFICRNQLDVKKRPLSSISELSFIHFDAKSSIIIQLYLVIRLCHYRQLLIAYLCNYYCR
jgi:hypothetical protein